MSVTVVPVLDDTGDTTQVLIIDPATWTYKEVWDAGGPAQPGLLTTGLSTLEAVLERAIGNSVTLHPGPAVEIATLEEALAQADELLLAGRPGVAYLQPEDVQRLSDLHDALEVIRAGLGGLTDVSVRQVGAAVERLSADLDRLHSQLDDIGYRPPTPRWKPLDPSDQPHGSPVGVAPPGTPLDSLGLPPWILGPLRNAGLLTAEDIDRAEARKLKQIDGLGPVKLARVERVVARALGRSIAEPVEPPGTHPVAAVRPAKPARKKSRPKPEVTLEQGVRGSIDSWREERGFGFLLLPDGRNAFLHVRDVKNGDVPTPGQEYTFDLEPARPGDRNPRAVNAKPVTQA